MFSLWLPAYGDDCRVIIVCCAVMGGDECPFPCPLPTGPFWRGWFEGLSELFLSVPTTKMLMLAGTDRLDTPLTIAQMQGKFQFKLLYGCGHTMQEDSPDQAAEAIRQLMQRIGLIQGRAGEVTEHQKLMQKLAKAKAMAPTVK